MPPVTLCIRLGKHLVLSEMTDDPHIGVTARVAGGLANALLCDPWQLLVVGSSFTDDETKAYRVSVTSQGDPAGKGLGRNSKLVRVKADPAGGIVISSLLGTYFPQDPTEGPFFCFSMLLVSLNYTLLGFTKPGAWSYCAGSEVPRMPD